MNRHERRRARAMAQENDFYNDYVAHLPKVPIDAPLERGKLYHVVMHHDDWCRIYSGEDCNCNPIATRHVEPKRT